MKASFNGQGFRSKKRNINTVNQPSKSQSSLSQQDYAVSLGSQGAYTQRTMNIRDVDQQDNAIAEQQNEAYMTAQQQEMIKGVLELVRKNKITHQNAYEFPIIVADPESVSDDNVKFWKFASQLLDASTFIYDKKVNHLSIEVDKISGKLTRINITQQKNDVENDFSKSKTSKKKKNELMKMDEIDKDFNLETMNTLNADRFNVNPRRYCKNGDPLFQKTLQTFDNNQLSGLFLNQFNVNQNLQITFLQSNKQRENPYNKKMAIQTAIPQMNHLWETSQIVKHGNLFQDITTFMNKQFEKSGQELFRQCEDYQKMYEEFCQIEHSKSRYEDSITSLNQRVLSIQLNPEDINHQQSTFSLRQQFFHSAEHNREDDSSTNIFRKFCYTEVRKNDLFADTKNENVDIPWQYEFKGNQLKKKKSQSVKTKGKSTKKINFKGDQLIDRDQILKMVSVQKLQFQLTDINISVKKLQKNIRPQNWSTSLRLSHEKIQNQQPTRGTVTTFGTRFKTNTTKPDTFYQQTELRQGIFEDISTINGSGQKSYLEHNKTQLDLSAEDSFHQLISNLSTQGLLELQTYGRLQIRQVKEKIYKQVNVRGQIRLSEVVRQTGLSVGSAFIVLLHLTNEWSFYLLQLEEQSDVILSVSQ